jgi:hypothetical protein
MIQPEGLQTARLHGNRRESVVGKGAELRQARQRFKALVISSQPQRERDSSDLNCAGNLAKAASETSVT